MFNSRLKEQLAIMAMERDELYDIKNNLVNFLTKERSRISSDLMKEKTKARPREKMVFALEMIASNLAMLQNRVLDNDWRGE